MTNEVEILLVEDNPYDAEMTIRVLKQRNLANNLLHLTDGEEALNFIFRKGKYKDRVNQYPKVILLDLKMPKVDGLEFLAKLKSNEETKTIPVVVLTSSNQDPDIKKCYELGVNSYVVKPVEFEAFIKAISDLGLYWMILNNPPSAR